jgi:hypothetical protein
MKRVLLSLLAGVVSLTAFIAEPSPAQDANNNAGTSSWVYFGPNHRLEYHRDAQGNRIMDFSYAGYEGGGVALPSWVPVRAVVSPMSGDNTANIQAAINAVAALPVDRTGFRGAVLLKPGTYEVDGSLNLNVSGVVLRGGGSGANGTILDMEVESGQTLFSISGTGSYQTVGTPVSITDTYIPAGSLSFHVSDPSSFHVGEPVLVNKPVTAAWVAFMGMNKLVRNGAPQTWIPVGSQIATDRLIARIEGNEITLDAPLADSYDSTYLDPPGSSVVGYTYPGRIEQVGVEHLSVVAPAATSPGYRVINMTDVLNGWLNDIQISSSQINSVAISGNTKKITLERVVVTHPVYMNTGNADFTISGTQTLMDRCAAIGSQNWPVVAQAEAEGPNVVLNFNSTQPSGISPHQRWATGFLADNATLPNSPSGTPGIAYTNRWNLGSGQGWDVGWGVGWNVTTPYYLVQNPPGSYNWCIGCVGEAEPPTNAPGPGAAGIVDSPNVPVSPQSLYLEQLIERKGPQALIDIGYRDYLSVHYQEVAGAE